MAESNFFDDAFS